MKSISLFLTLVAFCLTSCATSQVTPRAPASDPDDSVTLDKIPIGTGFTVNAHVFASQFYLPYQNGQPVTGRSEDLNRPYCEIYNHLKLLAYSDDPQSKRSLKAIRKQQEDVNLDLYGSTGQVESVDVTPERDYLLPNSIDSIKVTEITLYFSSKRRLKFDSIQCIGPKGQPISLRDLKAAFGSAVSVQSN